ncbi:hypothetical protein PO124_03870 [Bacillus licheniformis]|nr:hypothetical protein [Bacillus licheniformis]
MKSVSSNVNPRKTTFKTGLNFAPDVHILNASINEAVVQSRPLYEYDNDKDWRSFRKKPLLRLKNAKMPDCFKSVSSSAINRLVNESPCIPAGRRSRLFPHSPKRD